MIEDKDLDQQEGDELEAQEANSEAGGLFSDAESEDSLLLSASDDEAVFEEETEEDETSLDEESYEANGLADEDTPEELQAFESAEIEEKEFLDEERVKSIVESVLFATEKPQSLSVIKQAFVGTTVGTKQLRRAIETLMGDYAAYDRGVTIEEVNGGFQVRTKTDNMDYLKRMIKARPFKLSGPALEVLAIMAYKQPCPKYQVDEVRGVESGHLVRGLLDKGLVAFAGKSDLPGKPMLYQTTRKFLEIFGLRNIKELPSLSEIDQLLPDGIDPEDIEIEKETLGEVARNLETSGITSYSEATEELDKITGQLSEISTSSEFFEQEKVREKERREKEKASDIRERMLVGEEVSQREVNWLERFDEALLEQEKQMAEVDELAEVLEDSEPSISMGKADGEPLEESEVIEGRQEVDFHSTDQEPYNGEQNEVAVSSDLVLEAQVQADERNLEEQDEIIDNTRDDSKEASESKSDLEI